MANRKIFGTSIDKFDIPSKNSYQIFPLIKKGELVCINSNESQLLEDIGLGICSTLSTGSDLFMNDTTGFCTTPKFQKVLYLNSKNWNSEDNPFVSDFVKNYLTFKEKIVKPDNRDIPFATCNMQQNLFDFHFWNQRHSDVIKKEMFNYDAIVINDYNFIFKMKTIKFQEMLNLFKQYTSKNISIIMMNPYGVDKEKFNKYFDIVINITNTETIPTYPFTLNYDKYRAKQKPNPIHIKYEVV